MLGTLPKLGKQWRLSFDVKSPETIPSGWSNLIHAEAVTGDCCTIGQRIPAVWFNSDHGTQLTVDSAVNSNGQRNVRTLSISKDIWSTVEIKQQRDNAKYFYSVTVDETEIISEENLYPLEFYNVTIFASDNYSKPSGASIRNLIYENLVDNRGRYRLTNMFII